MIRRKKLNDNTKKRNKMSISNFETNGKNTNKSKIQSLLFDVEADDLIQSTSHIESEIKDYFGKDTERSCLRPKKSIRKYFI
jgi:hypothetical protein